MTLIFFGFRRVQHWIWVGHRVLASLTSIGRGYDGPSPQLSFHLYYLTAYLCGINEPIHVGEKWGILILILSLTQTILWTFTP